jgi:hypothetical protein
MKCSPLRSTLFSGRKTTLRGTFCPAPFSAIRQDLPKAVLSVSFNVFSAVDVSVFRDLSRPRNSNLDSHVQHVREESIYG